MKKGRTKLLLKLAKQSDATETDILRRSSTWRSIPIHNRNETENLEISNMNNDPPKQNGKKNYGKENKDVKIIPNKGPSNDLDNTDPVRAIVPTTIAENVPNNEMENIEIGSNNCNSTDKMSALPVNSIMSSTIPETVPNDDLENNEIGACNRDFDSKGGFTELPNAIVPTTIAENVPNNEMDNIEIDANDCTSTDKISALPVNAIKPTTIPETVPNYDFENNETGVCNRDFDSKGELTELANAIVPTKIPENVSNIDSDNFATSVCELQASAGGGPSHATRSESLSTNSISDTDDSDVYSSDDSCKDPNYHTNISSSSSASDSDTEVTVHIQPLLTDEIPPLVLTTEEEFTMPKGRKRKADPNEWKQNKAKLLRNSGKSYVTKKNKVVEDRRMGPVCPEKCTLKCRTKVDEETRKSLFTCYWNLGNINSQRNYLSSSMGIVDPVFRYTRPNSTRDKNRKFHFQIRGQNIRVCKKFFTSTLGISDRAIRTTITKEQSTVTNLVSTDNRGKHGKHKKLQDSIKVGVREHINAIPKIDSHYCRANTTRTYIEAGLNIADLHRNYVSECKENGVPFASYQIYYAIFTQEFNISFWTPKKDQCEDCTAYNNAEDKEALKEKYDSHLKEKELSRIEKEKDKNSVSKKLIVAVYDLQAVMSCPRGDVSTFYYVSKVNLFNFTVFELKNNNVDCFVWHEGEGDRGANEIGSCILQHLQGLQNKSREPFDVIYYSDNCSGQQKNRFVISLYMYAVSKFELLNSITHKYLIKGHSQNEGDCAHSIIERNIKKALKCGPIYVPDQYITLIKTAKKNGPSYRVHELDHESFYDLKNLTTKYTGTNFSMDEHNHKVKMADFRILKVQKDTPNTFYYKTSYEDEDFTAIRVTKSRSSRTNPSNIILKQLYDSKIEFPEKKKKMLLELIRKNSIPRYYANFYNSL